MANAATPSTPTCPGCGDRTRESARHREEFFCQNEACPEFDERRSRAEIECAHEAAGVRQAEADLASECGGGSELSHSYRNMLRDAGRGGLLR